MVIFEDRDGNGQYAAGTDNFLGSVSQGPLGAGETIDANIAVIADLQFNGSLIYATADTSNSVAEDDEANNTSHSGLSCRFEPQSGAFTPALEWAWTSLAVLPNHLNFNQDKRQPCKTRRHQWLRPDALWREP